ASACTRVVGIAEDARRGALREEPAMQYYLPVAQQDMGSDVLFVRPAPDAAPSIAAAVRRELLRLDPSLSYVTVTPLQDAVEPLVRPWRLGAVVFAILGALALAVAAVGLY